MPKTDTGNAYGKNNATGIKIRSTFWPVDSVDNRNIYLPETQFFVPLSIDTRNENGAPRGNIGTRRIQFQ
jgi:hypothetical protein